MRFGGIVFVALLVLGACSSDPVPKEPAATSSAPATPTATPPAMPEQAKQDSPEGAAAFVKHYVDVFNYAASTGDVDELSRLSAATCEGCQSYITLYRKTYDAGGYFKGGEWKIGDLQLQQEDDTAYLTTTVNVSDGAFRENSGASERTEPGEQTQVSFAAADGAKSWRITQLGLGEVE
jgi:hypothetical protein